MPSKNKKAEFLKAVNNTFFNDLLLLEVFENDNGK